MDSLNSKRPMPGKRKFSISKPENCGSSWHGLNMRGPERCRAQGAELSPRTNGPPKRARLSVIDDSEAQVRRRPGQLVLVARVRNSEFPVSDLEFRWHFGTAAIGQPDSLMQLLPDGEEHGVAH
jgi:hypothetical protein